MKESLNSIVNQTFNDEIEVLLIDDGSTDNSRIIMEEFALKYDNFRTFFLDHHGVCSVRNFGLKVARGEYIHLMDSDDFIVHYAYEKLYDCAKLNDSDIITSNYLRYDSKKTWMIGIAQHVFENLDNDIENTNLYEFPQLSWDMPLWNKLFKREFILKNNIKFPDVCSIYSDNPFTIECYAKAKKVYILNDVLYCWRSREVGKSITQNYDLNRVESFYKMVCIVNNILKENIHDKNVLIEKYEKLFTVDLFFLMESIKNDYPRKYQKKLFERVFDILMLVPDEYVNYLNSYYRTVYELVRKKDWKNSCLLLSSGFPYSPIIPDGLDKYYSNKLDLSKDSHDASFRSKAINASVDKNNIIINCYNFVLFNSKDNFEKINYKLLNENTEIYFKDSNNTLSIPVECLEFDQYNILTSYYFDGVKKEGYLISEIDKTFGFDEFSITLQKEKSGKLRLTKSKRDDEKIIIHDVNLKECNLEFSGFSDKKLTNVFMEDEFNFSRFKYPVNYSYLNGFSIKIPYSDLIKTPVMKWKIKSSSKIILENQFEFTFDDYTIFVKEYGNSILIELKK